MRCIQIELPDQLAEDAEQAGLLRPERIALLLRQELDQRERNEFFAGMDRAAAIPDPPYMSMEEISELVREVRAERRARAQS